MSRTRGDIMDEPEGGWLHDKKALAVGEGLYYSFPLTFVGHVVLKESLTKLSDADRTFAMRVIMRRLLREAGVLKKPEKEQSPAIKKFTGGEMSLAMIPVNLGISAQSLVVTANIDDDIMEDMGLESGTVLLQHQMKYVSMAAGGVGSTYDLVAYVGKNRNGRACYVFDCGKLTEEVFATLGQAFTVAQEMTMKSMDKPNFDDIEVSGYFDVTGADDFDDEDEEPKIKEVTKKVDAAFVTPSGNEYENLQESVYSVMTDIVPLQEEENPYDIPIDLPEEQKKAVTALNKYDSMRRAKKNNIANTPKLLPIDEEETKESVQLQRASTTQQQRPTWVCVSETAKMKDPGAMNTLLKNFKLRAVIEEVFSSDEEDD
eukprot:m.93452 g.93452  ORF g.93452 m.93452 type:complete len:373 (+) comp12386_c2_seq1:52-1170(+)